MKVKKKETGRRFGTFIKYIYVCFVCIYVSIYVYIYKDMYEDLAFRSFSNFVEKTLKL